jgi:hypothetical protein
MVVVELGGGGSGVASCSLQLPRITQSQLLEYMLHNNDNSELNMHACTIIVNKYSELNFKIDTCYSYQTELNAQCDTTE